MRIEYIPIAAGVAIFLFGLAIIWDAWGPQTLGPMRERRRRARADVNPAGEVFVGVGALLFGIALAARDWRFGTAVILVGTICIVVGALKNRKYFQEVFLFRGPTRREPVVPKAKSGRMRIR